MRTRAESYSETCMWTTSWFIAIETTSCMMWKFQPMIVKWRIIWSLFCFFNRRRFDWFTKKRITEVQNSIDRDGCPLKALSKKFWSNNELRLTTRPNWWIKVESRGPFVINMVLLSIPVQTLLFARRNTTPNLLSSLFTVESILELEDVEQKEKRFDVKIKTEMNICWKGVEKENQTRLMKIFLSEV